MYPLGGEKRFRHLHIGVEYLYDKKVTSSIKTV